MLGYHGQFLKVDLDRGRCEEMPVEANLYEQFIGGASLAAALIYDHVQPDMDPLGPDSPLVFATGPLTATQVPMVSRYAVCAISPLTGFWGEATSGGNFPFRLKGTGYDGIFITGRAEGPVILHIENGQAQLIQANDLWGLDTYQTQAAIREKMGGSSVSTACIGPAGERQLNYAAIMNDRGRAAGRCGLGAVMGSKNLKAVVVGGGRKPEYADKKTLNALARDAMAAIQGDLISVALKEYGTLFYMDMAMALGDVPAKYYRQSVFPAEKISGQALRQKYTVETYACQGCPVGCGREVKDVRQDLRRVDGPEYETAAAFGPLCMNYDLESIVEANHLCNAYGMDTISTAASIAYLMHLFEEGVVTEDRTGMPVPWGDGAAIIQLVHMIAKGEGIGELLGQGTLAMAKAFGRDTQEAAQVKGMEIPMHDARAFTGQAVSYATNPRGGCHLKGEYFNIELGAKVKEYKLFPGDRFASDGKGVNAAKLQSLADLFDALTLCKFAHISVTQICNILNAITGWSITPETLLETGHRSVSLKRAISNKLGVTRAHDTVPKIAATALTEGASAGKAPNMELMLKDYYEYRGWDWQTGKPLEMTLKGLGLSHVAEDLYAI
jgi:aldehyde:ferredoxin oxidoreductase